MIAVVLLAAVDGDKTTMVELRAAELLGKTIGLFKDVQVQEKPMTTEEIDAEIEARFGREDDAPST